MSTVREADGLLFIGDPHVSSRRPGRRRDVDFASTVLRKLAFCLDQAEERRLVPVVLGDLLDRPVEDDESLKTRLVRLLRGAWTRPIVLVGNHEKRNASLSDGDTLAMIAACGVATVVEDGGPIETLLLNGIRVGVGGTPHGQDIPTSVEGMFEDVRGVVWLTHHDVAFEGAYPGSFEPFEIRGCKMVVNGHNHMLKEPIDAGATRWYNFGNILRQRIDAIEHEPAAWAFVPGAAEIEKVPIPHDRGIFDLTGRLVAPGEAQPAEEPAASAFVELLRTESSTDLGKTDDASVVREVIERKFDAESTEPEVQAIVLAYWEAAAKAAKAA